MSFKPYTEKIKKKIGICSILGRIRIRIQNQTRIRIHHPGSGSADPDPDPHQNDTDPKHCCQYSTLTLIQLVSQALSIILRYNESMATCYNFDSSS